MGQSMCQLTLVIATHYHINLASNDGTLWELQRNWERVFPFVPKLHDAAQISNRSYRFPRDKSSIPAVLAVGGLAAGPLIPVRCK